MKVLVTGAGGFIGSHVCDRLLHLGVDPEGALRVANAKFVRRFRSIEAALRAEGRTPEDATLEEMDQLWDEAKAAETAKE